MGSLWSFVFLVQTLFVHEKKFSHRIDYCRMCDKKLLQHELNQHSEHENNPPPPPLSQAWWDLN